MWKESLTWIVPRMLFILRKHKNVSKSSHKNAPAELRAQVTGVANHLGRERRGPVRAKADAPAMTMRETKPGWKTT